VVGRFRSFFTDLSRSVHVAARGPRSGRTTSGAHICRRTLAQVGVQHHDFLRYVECAETSSRDTDRGVVAPAKTASRNDDGGVPRIRDR
jgi:hypothetical protein